MAAYHKVASLWGYLLGAVLFLGVAWEWLPDNVLYDKNRIEQIILLCVLAGIVFYSPRTLLDGWGAIASWTRAALTLAFCLGWLSAVLAPMPRFALLEWATVLLLVCASLVLSARDSGAHFYTARPVHVFLAAVGVVVVLKVMVGYLAALVGGVRLDTLLLFEGTFPNRRYFGQMATLLVPLFALACWRASRSLQRFLWFILLSLWWMLVVVSGTRGAWLALLVAHMGIALWSGRASLPFLGIQVSAAGVGLLGFLALFQLVPWFLGLDAAIENRLEGLTSLSLREAIWALAWNHVLQHPWLGIGPMHFAAIINPVAAHPHNAVLQLAAEWGLPSTLMLLSVSIGGLGLFIRPLRGQLDQVRLALAVSLFAASIHAMVDGVIVVPYTQIWLSFVVGWALWVHLNGTGPDVSGGGAVWVVRLITAGALGFVLLGSVPEIFNRSEAVSSYLERHDGLVPRFWSVGWIP